MLHESEFLSFVSIKKKKKKKNLTSDFLFFKIN